jgi:serine/arginine repetitive matrix protein 2
MQALLEHSVQSYRPLPSDLRSRRVRTSSRPSPYPQSRVSKITISPDQTRPSNVEEVQKALATPVLQEVKVNTNVKSSTVPSLEAIKPFSPIFLDVEPKRENAYGLAPAARPRVPSNARRSALGWSKRSTGGKSSTDQKENVVGQGVVKTFVPFLCFLFYSAVTDNLNAFDRPGETLRLNRPRPRGRATPGTQQRTSRPIRI